MNEDFKRLGKKRINKSNLPISVLLGTICGISIMLIFSIIFSLLILKIKNPVNYSEILSIICVASGGASTGIVSSMLYKQNAIISSSISLSIISFVLFFSILNGRNNNVINLVFFPLIVFAVGMSSAFIVNGKNKKKKIKRYMR